MVLMKTRHIVQAIENAHSSTSRLIHIEDLIVHLKQYPEAKHNAVKVDISFVLYNYLFYVFYV